MPYWMSIEVFDAAFSASLWQESHGDALVETAIIYGAVEWNWQPTSWGMVFEVAFADEEAWDHYRATLTVQRRYRRRAHATGRGRPSSSIATNVKVASVTFSRCCVWNRLAQASTWIFIEVRPTPSSSA